MENFSNLAPFGTSFHRPGTCFRLKLNENIDTECQHMNNTQSIRETGQESNLLRNALRGNALFSGLSGVVFIFAAQSLVTFTGVEEPLVFIVLGVVLILLALDLIWIASRESIDRRFV